MHLNGLFGWNGVHYLAEMEYVSWLIRCEIEYVNFCRVKSLEIWQRCSGEDFRYFTTGSLVNKSCIYKPVYIDECKLMPCYWTWHKRLHTYMNTRASSHARTHMHTHRLELFLVSAKYHGHQQMLCILHLSVLHVFEVGAAGSCYLCGLKQHQCKL